MATGVEEAIAYGVTKGAIGALAKPAVSTALAGLKSLSARVIEIFGERLTDYVAQQAHRHSCMSTIVFGHQKSLHDLYVPLTVIASADRTDARSGILVDRFANDFLPKQNRVLITDTAGMGKSTLSKFLFLQCLKSGYAVPFFIELRHLTATTGVLSVLLRQLNPPTRPDAEPRFTKSQLQRFLKTGSLVFFFDGYDEIPPTHREAVTKDIKEVVELYPQHTYVITSRPESGLLAFPDFKQYTIRPLTRDESFSLIRRYDEGSGRAEQLIAKLHGPDFQAVHEFLKNPLLTSLLYRSFEYKQSVPLKKHVFYRQVFDALFDWHDATKDGYNTREKRSGLDIDSFHRMLRVVGFLSVMKGQVEGDTDAVLGWIRKAKEVCTLTAVPESHFLDDLVRAVPVFVKDGDFYRWSHKSLAEYFAAQYLCTEGKSQQETVLSTFISTRQIARFTNVLDQIYDIDNAAFREHLILPVSKAFSTYWANSYRDLDPNIPEEEVRRRKCSSFDRITIFFPSTDFRAREDFKKAVSDAVFSASGNELGSEPVSIVMINENTRKYAKLIVSVPGPLNTILSILENKKDPLVVNRSKLPQIDGPWANRGRAPQVIVGDKPAAMTDDPTADYNQLATFSKLTESMIATGAPVVDPEAMLRFENSFKGAAVLSAITDELLGALREHRS